MAVVPQKPAETATFKRSRDRCHIINMMWVYDSELNLLCNSFRYSAGDKYEIDALEAKHVPHVLTGYYVRRAMNVFVGESGNSMVRLPITKELIARMRFVNMQRFILCLPRQNEILPSSLVTLTQLNRDHMRLAIDVYTLVYTRWAQLVKQFDFVLIDMHEDLQEQLHMCANVKALVPQIKIIARCHDFADCRKAFASGANYVCCYDFLPELLLKRIEKRFTAHYPTMFSDVCSSLLAQFSATHNPIVFDNFLKRYLSLSTYVKPVVEIVNEEISDTNEFTGLSNYAQAAAMLGIESIHWIETILCLRLLAMRFESSEDRRSKRCTYMPFKMALEEGYVWHTLVKDPQLHSLMPIFTLGVIHGLTHFIAQGSEMQEPSYVELMNQFKKTLNAYPLLSNIAQAYDALQRSELERLQQLAKEDGNFTGPTMSSAFEKSLMWVESLVKAMSTADE